MKKIALTGNIGSGKSEVEQILKNQGIKVIDTDMITRKLINEIQTKEKIIKAFDGYKILDINGEISRKKLGEIIFSNEYNKINLEKIMHPLILQKMDEFFEENKEELLVVASIPLLFELNLQTKFDEIILVVADEKIRLKRILKRGYSKENAQLRINSQLSQEAKIDKSNIIIENNSTLENLKNEVLQKIMRHKVA